MRIAITSLLIILCLAFSTPAFAADYYNNGPTNGTSYAYFIDVDLVSDSFTTAGGIMFSFTFAEWVAAGAIPLTVDWAVGTSSFGSDVGAGSATFGQGGSSAALLCSYGSQYNGGPCGGGFGYDVYNSTVDMGEEVGVPAGTYWLTLTNATDSLGGRDGWDINSGASLAYHNLLGAVPSESFTINNSTCQMGNNSPDCGPPPSPEPGSIVLFGSGLLGPAGFLRRKLS